MNKKEFERLQRLYEQLESMGFSTAEVDTMIRLSRRLSRWCERECNGEVERDVNGLTWAVWQSVNGQLRCRCRDMETPSIKRLDAILKDRPLNWYYQADPRGAAVYIYNRDHPMLAKYSIGSCYSSIGIAVY